ncbi:MAG: hypothetical protein ACTH1D_04560 [Mycobacteriaceae bacterium]|uniref:hypothetical protein n=1 Tax=Corynebacterium sp. TaxID=1720 RepID=UPI003F986C39
MANYDLYTELHLDKDMPPSGISEILGGRISDLKGQGYTGDTPEIDQLETALAILGDPYKRDVYEAALYGGQDDVVNIRWLHDLADSKTPPGGAPSAPEPEPGPSPYSAPTRQEEFSSYSPSSPLVPESSMEPASTETPDDQTSQSSQERPVSGARDDDTAVVDAVSVPGGPDAPSATPSGTDDPEGGRDSSGGPSAGTAAAGTAAAAGAAGVAGAAAGSSGAHRAQSGSSWQQSAPQDSSGFGGTPYSSGPYTPDNPSSLGGFGSDPQAAQGSSRTSQLDTSRWGVGGRSRSESKIYLGILAVIVVGMLYPLIILFSTGSDDFDAVFHIMKAMMFTLFWVAAWLGINEIIWGVRRIVAPDTANNQDKVADAATEK